MTSTEKLYGIVNSYVAELRAAYDEFAGKLAANERARGSELFDDITNDARAKRDGRVSAARDAAISGIDAVFSDMNARAAMIEAPALTPEQVGILQVLKMHDDSMRGINIDELRAAARAMHGNFVGLSVLDDMARKSGHAGENFGAQASALYGEPLLSALRAMRRQCIAFVGGSGASRARELEARYHGRRYGAAEPDIDALPRVDRFADEDAFMAWLVPTGVRVDALRKAVDE